MRSGTPAVAAWNSSSSNSFWTTPPDVSRVAKRLNEIVTDFVCRKWVVEANLEDPMQGAHDYVFNAGLGGAGHCDGISIAWMAPEERLVRGSASDANNPSTSLSVVQQLGFVHAAESFGKRTRRRELHQRPKFRGAAEQSGNFIVTHKLRIHPYLDLVTGDLLHYCDDVHKCNCPPAADVDDFGMDSALQERQVGRNHILHIRIVPAHVQVAELNERRAVPEVLDDLGNQEVVRLPGTGVIEGACNDDREPGKPVSDAVLHGQFAVGVVVDRRRANGLIHQFDVRRAIHVCAARNNHPVWRALQFRQCVQEVFRTQYINSVEVLSVAMRNERDGAKMNYGIGLRSRHCLLDSVTISQITGQRPGRIQPHDPESPRPQGGLQITAGKPVSSRQKRGFHRLRREHAYWQRAGGLPRP